MHSCLTGCHPKVIQKEPLKDAGVWCLEPALLTDSASRRLTPPCFSDLIGRKRESEPEGEEETENGEVEIQDLQGGFISQTLLN